MFLLDTNTVIYYFKGLGQVSKHLLSTAPSQVGISTVTVFELLVGIAKASQPSKRRRQLGTLLSSIQVLPFGDLEARAASTIRADLEKRGKPIGPLDNLIAGTARAHGATLVTRNLEEFRRIKDLPVESWY